MNSINKQQGFIDRTDSRAARFGFGVYNLWWVQKEQEYDLQGLYFFKGNEIPKAFMDHQLMEYHFVKKLTPLTNGDDKKLIEAYWGCRFENDFSIKDLKLHSFMKWQ